MQVKKHFLLAIIALPTLSIITTAQTNITQANSVNNDALHTSATVKRFGSMVSSLALRHVRKQ